jgi:serine/threonine-protein kinase
MGMVYEATDLVLDRIVAVKVLRLELLEREDFAASLLNEGQCLAALSGEHAVRVSDAGWLDSGAPFLVMERLIGKDLAALLRLCGRFSAQVAVDYALQACAGLAEAHAAGLIHCDVKPANLFLAARRGAPPCIKLIDFGIARWIGAAVTKRDSGSEDRNLFGSPSYCSPEQLEHPDLLDERTDIWSLGVVLFELLTGVSPYAQRGRSALRSRMLFQPRPRVRALRPDIDARLEAVVECCLEKDRERRFRCMRELRAALLPFASNPASSADLPC